MIAAKRDELSAATQIAVRWREVIRSTPPSSCARVLWERMKRLHARIAAQRRCTGRLWWMALWSMRASLGQNREATQWKPALDSMALT